MASSIDVFRGDLLESRHRVSVAVMRADGTLVAHSGDSGLAGFMRSCAKPFQALALVEDGAADAYGFGADALALACASHNGEPEHVALARRMLAASGASDADLVCGPHASLNDDVARAMSTRGEKPARAHNNCSGKHAGMIGAARHNGWGSAGYEQPDHPLQRRCVAETARWAGVPESQVRHAVDGCGVPTFALPLRAMALAWARFGARDVSPPGANGDTRAAATRLLDAMIAHPFMVAGTARLDTQLIAATRGRVVSKVGAEGVYCAAIPEQALGIALKVEDGAARCLGPALLGVLDTLLPGAVPPLESHRHPGITNTLGATVGHIEARVVLDRDAS